MRLLLFALLAPVLARRGGHAHSNSAAAKVRTNHAQAELALVRKGLHKELKDHPKELHRVEALLQKASKAAQRAGHEKHWAEELQEREEQQQPDFELAAAEANDEDPAISQRDRAIVAEAREAKRSLGHAFEEGSDEEELDESMQGEEVERETGLSLDQDLGKLERAFSNVQATERRIHPQRGGRIHPQRGGRIQPQRGEEATNQHPHTQRTGQATWPAKPTDQPSWTPSHEGHRPMGTGRYEELRTQRPHRQSDNNKLHRGRYKEQRPQRPHRQGDHNKLHRGSASVTGPALAHRYPSMHQVFYDRNVQLAEHSARLLAHLGQLSNEVDGVLQTGDKEDIRAGRAVRGHLRGAMGVVRDLALFHTRMAREAKAHRHTRHRRPRAVHSPARRVTAQPQDLPWSREEDEVRSDLYRARQAADAWERDLSRVEHEGKLEDADVP